MKKMIPFVMIVSLGAAAIFALLPEVVGLLVKSLLAWFTR